MDNNLNPAQPQVPPAATGIPQAENPAPPAAPSMPIPPQEGAKKGSKLPLIIGIIAVSLILAGAGFWFMSRSKAPKTESATQVSQTAPDVAALNTLSQELEADLNSIDVGDVAQDLSEVDEDLKQL